jgi:hypothetical protein
MTNKPNYPIHTLASASENYYKYLTQPSIISTIPSHED